MPFTVEDGTGIANANSYVDTAFADEYFADRGVTAWAGDAAAKQGALIKATDYVEGRFGRRWIGEMANATQGLSWPRKDTDFDIDEIPLKLKQACSEYALRALSGPLAPDPKTDASGITVVTTRKKVGPIETEFQPVGSGTPAMFKPYPAADMLLSGLLEPINNRVIR